MSEPRPARALPHVVSDTGTTRPGSEPLPLPKLQPDALATFIELEIEARQCTDLQRLRYAITNSTRRLAGYDNAVLLELDASGKAQLTCASSIQKVDRHAPFVQHLQQLITRAMSAADMNLREPRLMNLQQAATSLGLPVFAQPLQHGFWLPLKSRKGVTMAALLSLRQAAWQPAQLSMLIPLAGAYAHAWEALTPENRLSVSRALGIITGRRLALAAVVLAIVAGIVPVPMSSLAPAEIVAREPMLVTAPIEGVIKDILLPPGSLVEKGMPIITFVDVALRNNFELAQRNMDVAQARYFRVIQAATATQKNVEEVAIAKAELDVSAGELAYAREMLGKVVIRAERPGLLIYSSKSDWVGRPVRVGERMMEIGSPDHTELKVDLPVEDALTLRQGGKVSLFLDGDPLHAIEASITRANYRPAPNAEGQLVYRVNAAFTDDRPRRIGLRGVARVSAGNVPLAFYLFRRPIAALRQRLGL